MKSIRHYLLAGLALSLVGAPISVAQADDAVKTLSPAAMKILCERFPLNSRCTGETSVSAEDAAAPVAEEPVMEEPAMEEPVMEEPTMEEPTMEEPAMEEPAAEEPAVDESTEAKTVVELAGSNESFSTLTAAIEAAGLTETLSGEGPFTVFAPTDEAFAALPPGALDQLLLPENKEVLTKVLTYHVLPTKAVSTELTSGEVSTVEGSSAQVTVAEGGVMVNDANVVEADIVASNGVIHVIDKVIIPPDLI